MGKKRQPVIENKNTERWLEARDPNENDTESLHM